MSSQNKKPLTKQLRTSPPTNGWNEKRCKAQTKLKHGKDRVLIQVIRDDFVVDTHILVLKGARHHHQAIRRKKSVVRSKSCGPEASAIKFRWGSSVKWGKNRKRNKIDIIPFSTFTRLEKKSTVVTTRYISGIPQYVYTLNFHMFISPFPGPFCCSKCDVWRPWIYYPQNGIPHFQRFLHSLFIASSNQGVGVESEDNVEKT